MKTVTVSKADLIRNYTTAMIDIALDNDPEGMEDTAGSLARDLRNLFSAKRSNVVGTLRLMFSQGFTMMLLGPDQFDFLDAAERDEEDFCVQVTDEGETLCLICKSELSW